MFGLSKVAVQAIGAAVVLALGFLVLHFFGNSKYEQGEIAGRIAAREANRAAVIRAIDSTAHAADVRLSAFVRANDSLAAENARLQRSAASAKAASLRALAVLRGVPDSVRLHTDARLTAAIDSLVAANADLMRVVDDLARSNEATRLRADSAISFAAEARRLQALTRAQVDSADRTIADLRKLKNPPRCGFKCGATTATLTIVAIVATIRGVTH